MPGEQLFEARAVSLNYLEQGPSAAQPLVMLHGGAWCWQEYLSLIPTLAERWRVFASDLRGNGRSGWVPGTYRLDDFAEDTTEFIGKLEAPAVLVGHSIGGVVALLVAARCPDKIRALIIEDAPLTVDNYRRVVDSSRDMFGLWLNLKNKAQSADQLALALADAYKDLPGITSPWIMFFADCLWRLDPTFFDTLLQDFESFIAGYDYRQILPAIDRPILFIRGESRLGAVMTDDEISWLETNFPQVRCALIDGVGHLLHLENHGQTPVLTAMTAFLERL